MKTEKDFGGYWLRSISNFKGHEGELLFQATVLKDGEKIGFFSEDSWGGPAQLSEFSKEDELALIKYAKEVDEKPWGESYHLFLTKIASEIDFQKKLKRKAKKEILFYVGEDIHYLRCKPTKENKTLATNQLNKKYGEGNWRFLTI